MQYNFEWDPKKAKSNISKHKVSFEQAASVFKNKNAISIYDKEHSKKVDQWITIGINTNGLPIVVNHTYNQVNKNTIIIRIISSRKALKNELKQYMER